MTNKTKQRAKKFALACCSTYSVDAGVKIAKTGANAADVAVTMALDLIVTNPLMCSIGGGGFATVMDPDGSVKVIDFFSAMPGKGLPHDAFEKARRAKTIHIDYGVGVDLLIGHKSVSVPGTLRGLETLLRRHGTLEFKDIVKPAIDHAREGILLNSTVAMWIDISAESIQWYTPYSKQILSNAKGEKPKEGEIFKQPDLANTLELIGKYGADIIYEGEIADLITEELLNNGGFVTKKDLKGYQAIIREPLKTSYRNCDVYTNPPPSAGGSILINMLKVASHFDMTKKYEPETTTALGKLIKQSMEERYTEYKEGNNNLEKFNQLNTEENIFDKYKKIKPSANTTHLSVVDDLGNAVSITMSMGYGSGVAIKGTGIMMDNVLGELELNPLGFYALNPGDRFVSNMAPSIMTSNNNSIITAIGSPGASRIPSCLFHVITNIVDLGLGLETAVDYPRFHYEEDKFAIEPGIKVIGDKISGEILQFNNVSMYFGGAQCAQVIDNKEFKWASDSRRSGTGSVAYMN